MPLFGSHDLHSLVNRSIRKVRQQGDPPERDILAGQNHYRCDICRTTFERTVLVQCGLCGRWACRQQCWSSDGVCITCQGVINLSKESVRLDIRKTKAEGKSKENEKVAKGSRKGPKKGVSKTR